MAVAIELYRIDDRLIHGQVVVGWGQPLDIGFIVLVDDEVAGSEWEQELYRCGVPPGMDVYFHTVDQAAEGFPRFAADRRVGMVLTKDIETMQRLVARVPTIRGINVGGLHYRAGRVQKLRYVFLAPDEEGALRALADRGITITAQDVPAARAIPVADLLAGRGDR